MRVFETVDDIRSFRRRLTGTVGFVPTMGYLHQGHVSLIRKSKQLCDHTIVSIFVNPTQFSPSEDYDSYPRDIERDIRILSSEGVDAVFSPSVQEMYPLGMDVIVDPGPIANKLEGARRPGHFKGVATIVCKLFNIIGPDMAFFGQKDAQQIVVLHRVVTELHIPVKLVPCPTVREDDGLAMSSRNVYLTPEERLVAPTLYQALMLVRDRWLAGETSCDNLKNAARELLSQQPLIRLEYISIADPYTLEELDSLAGNKALVSLAAYIGRARLIDNIVLGFEEEVIDLDRR